MGAQERGITRHAAPLLVRRGACAGADNSKGLFLPAAFAEVGVSRQLMLAAQLVLPWAQGGDRGIFLTPSSLFSCCKSPPPLLRNPSPTTRIHSKAMEAGVAGKQQHYDMHLPALGRMCACLLPSLQAPRARPSRRSPQANGPWARPAPPSLWRWGGRACAARARAARRAR